MRKKVTKTEETIRKEETTRKENVKKLLIGFDTGGYTGDWDGSYGKLAMLHKKELILNESDTKNFLASMEVMERILQILDLQAISSQVGGILTTPAFKNTGNQTIE